MTTKPYCNINDENKEVTTNPRGKDAQGASGTQRTAQVRGNKRATTKTKVK